MATVVYSSGGWAPFFSLLWLIGLPTLIILGITHLVRGSRQSYYPPQPDPEAILKVRLASGEIDAEEYERLRGLIRS